MRHKGMAIGIDLKTGREVWLSRQALQQGLISLTGVSGAGKTTLLRHLIGQDLAADRGLAVVEPAGDLTMDVLAAVPDHRLPDVVLLNLLDCGEEAFSLNIFERPHPYTPTEVAKTASQVYHIFERAWEIGPQTPQLSMVLRHTARILIDCRATFAEIPLLLQDAAVRQRMLRRVSAPHTKAFFAAYEAMSNRDKTQYVSSFLNKADAYLQEGIAPILSQERSTVDFRTIMDSGKVLLVLLSPQLSEMSRLIGSMVIAGLLRAAFSRADTPEERRRPFSLYIDEFQTFLTEDTAVLIHEARKWRLSPIVLACQDLGQLDQANRAAVLGASTRITFRVSPDTARQLAGAYDTTPTPQVIGEEPIRSPVSDVVSHLVHKGHHNGVIARFVSEYLLPLQAMIRKVGTWQYPFEFGCVLLTAAHLIEGQRLVNEVLAEANRSGRADGIIPPYALFILGGAADDGITHVFSDHLRRSFLSGPDFLGITPSAHKFGRADFLADDAAVAALLHKKLARRRVWDDLFRSRMTTPGPSFLKMLKSLRAVMAILSREPVMVDTGQYRPRLQQRTFADQLGEIQNQLTNLKNYQAKVKTLSGEHVIKTLPPPPGLSGPALAERIARITRQMKFLGITRPVAEVNEEIRKRQERLRRGI